MGDVVHTTDISHIVDDVDFWTDDPSTLLKNFCIIPHRDSSKNQILNCLTTLAVLVAIVLLLLKYPMNYVILGALAVIIIIAVYAKMGLREGFSRTRHHIDDDFIETSVTPLVAEEWDLEPPAYELVTDIASDGRDPTQRVFGKKYDMEPPQVPYRQYLTRTNLLPSDEAEVSLFNGGATGARTFMNDAFTRHDLAFKENTSRLYKKSMDRRLRNLGYSTISPFTSF